MLDKLPVELLQVIAFRQSHALAGRDVVAMAMTCKRMHGAVLGSRFVRRLATAMSGYDACIAHGEWGGAQLALSRLNPQPVVRFWQKKSRVEPVFAVAGEAADDSMWQALVIELARARAVVARQTQVGAELGSRRGLSPNAFYPRLSVAALAVEAGLIGLALKVLPLTDEAGRGCTLVAAAGRGEASVVMAVLRESPTPGTVYLETAIAHAAFKNNVGILEALLAQPSGSPSGDNHLAVVAAAGAGAYDAVELLLADGRSDPSARGNRAIYDAAAGGHADVVALLLSEERVNPNARNRWPVCAAAANGHVAVVKLLLNDPRKLVEN
ncbi:uncharacterized protein AMSG_08114 [Thecamonas trahens ATCC 50062]|uniref:Uncharacterized protein n=1 Tax=Thecamonas trahens ATCC 50062 TaxID=461836 RepID=A0A0L0DMC8_THETB|nr:hypothetical protein AMSG_08114 [Thecamonas trahens ATCC 50062]KNC52548.1 hypothetical protein AMSG_08114 [Thecamonas trahens ATCC 50062]|eukprot:XP_013755339.1 hypothetical protein AMSG_08114 [Thecamonas trahens ATCC 50062]